MWNRNPVPVLWIFQGCGEAGHVAGAHCDFPRNPGGACLCAFTCAADRGTRHMVGDSDRMDPGRQRGIVETVEVEKSIKKLH